MAILSPNEMLGRNIEPKLKNRFVFYVEDIPSFLIKGCTIPGFNTGEVQVNHINTYKKYAGGRRIWNDISLTLYDPVAPSGQQAVFEWANMQYEDVTGRAGYSDYYKRDCTLSIVGGPGDVIGEWIIKGAFIKESNFGDLNFDNPEDLVTLDLTLTYDYAVLNF